MKLITYRYEGEEAIGIFVDDRVIPMTELGVQEKTMLSFIQHGGQEQLAALEERVRSYDGGIPFQAVTLEAPIPEPGQDILCLGINYMDHAEESARFKLETFDGKREHPCILPNGLREPSGMAPVFLRIRRSLVNWIMRQSWQ